MVMCNARIVLIDFSVQQPKDYSFFIDDELFDLSVKGKPGSYNYQCAINEEADTPRNRIRKKQKRLDYRKSVALIVAFALTIIGVLGFAVVSQKEPPPVENQALLQQNGILTSARIHLQTSADQPDMTTFSYSFIADGQVRNYRQMMEDGLVNGFPLENDDEFRLQYLPGRSGTHLLQLDQPTDNQLNRYLDRTIRRHQELNPKLTASAAACQVKVAHRLGGVEALAVMFHQQAPQQAHPLYNELSYKKLIRDIPFMEAVEKECWK